MLAMTYEGPYRIKPRHQPDPRIEHPGDVVLRVTRTAICGSDLHLLHGLVMDTRVGSIFGHEFTGIVEEAGQEVRTLRPGDRVVVPFTVSCGSCFYCSRGLTANCENSNPGSDLGGALGYSHTTGGYEGGQAELVRVPYADAGPMKIPDDMEEEEVLFLSDILPTGYQAAEMGEIQPGQTVAVFGCGPVGIFAAKCAWLLGAGRVLAVDRVPYRLDFARRYAQVEPVNFEEVEDVIASLKEETGGRGPDVCIDAVGCEARGSARHWWLGRKLKVEAGSATALEWAIQAVRKGGVVSIVGVYGPPWNLIPIGTAMNKGLTLRMNQCNVKRYMEPLLKHIRQGRIDAKGIITHRFSLQDGAEAYRLFANKLDGCVKCVLIPRA